MALAGLLALFPMIAALVSIYGLVADPAEVSRQVESLEGVLPEDVAGIVTEQMRAVASADDTGLGFGLILAVLLALWSASSGTKGLMNGINVAYDEQETRKFIPLRATALFLTLLAIVGVTVAVTLVAVVPAVLDSVGLGALEPVIQILRWPLLALGLMAFLALIYRLAPDRDNPKLKWTSPGAIAATVLWLLGSALFSFYVSTFGSYDKTYGTIAGVVVTILWLLLTTMCVLIGAMINAELERQTLKDTTVGPPKPIGARGAEVADDKPATRAEREGKVDPSGAGVAAR